MSVIVGLTGLDTILTNFKRLKGFQSLLLVKFYWAALELTMKVDIYWGNGLKICL